MTEAIKERANLIGLAVVLGAGAVCHAPWLLCAGLIGEVAYLITMPHLRWYAAHLEARNDVMAARCRRELREAVMPRLPEEMRRRVARLETLSQQFAAQPVTERAWQRDIARALDALLEQFLRLAEKEVRFHAYLNTLYGEAHAAMPTMNEPVVPFTHSTHHHPDPPTPQLASDDPLPPDPYDRWVAQTVREIARACLHALRGVERAYAEEANPDTRAVLAEHADVLRRRQDALAKLGGMLCHLHHQLSLLEDTFALVNDEIHAHPPEHVLEQVTTVISSSHAMLRVLEEYAEIDNGGRGGRQVEE